jgi:hypothetical protein
MPKQELKEPSSTLEKQLIETMLAGHYEWRPDLFYPESYSDMQGCARALLRRFDIVMRPLDVELEYDD